MKNKIALVNASPNKMTVVSNSTIQNPNISSIAKTIYCILLSMNIKDGLMPDINIIASMMYENRKEIESGINELYNLHKD